MPKKTSTEYHDFFEIIVSQESRQFFKVDLFSGY